MKGLTEEDVLIRREKYGKNVLTVQKKDSFIKKIVKVITEPMFLLLLCVSVIYFVLGEVRDGLTMLVFIIAMIGIDAVNEYKTDKTLNALKKLSSLKINVIRDGKKKLIDSEELVVDDIMLIHEGVKVPADGMVITSSGLSIDEASLTGEAVPVFKDSESVIYAGTLVIQGTGTIKVTKIGSDTEYGKIGVSLANINNSITPLQKQVNKIVKICAIMALVCCILVAIITFINLDALILKKRIIESILSGATLAMAMIPEEFPVVLTVFLSMGAWRLAKKKSLVKKMSSVETLGSVSVLCVDKTGTITMNKMEVDNIWANAISDDEVCKYMGMCSIEDTFDPMEIAIFNKCKEYGIDRKKIFENKKYCDYPFSNKTKIMGTVYHVNKKYLLAAKGSPEGILKQCHLDKNLKIEVLDEIELMSKKGLRVIAVAKKELKESELRENLDDYDLDFMGFVGLIDPPRTDIEKNIKTCNDAGIRVVMITGDNGVTASSIAKKIGIINSDKVLTGEDLDNMSDEELKKKVCEVNIFSRVVPNDKMRIVKALKENDYVVAMTGDGVNDAPALKYADIGIAMGKRGTEVSREAADLILMDDNFSTIVDTVGDGRRIYDNIKKAIEYIFIIHLPIALSSLMAPLLKISTSNLLLLPVHIVLLELIIDPTSSIIFERQPADDDIMDRNPRNKNELLVNFETLSKSVFQGLFMFLGSFLTYFYFLNHGYNIELSRSMGLTIIVISNLFLVFVNSSESDFVYKSIKKIKTDKVIMGSIIVTLFAIFISLYTPLHKFLKLAPLNINQLLIVIIISFISIFWYEIVKLVKKI